jgi:hypothetical protein
LDVLPGDGLADGSTIFALCEARRLRVVRDVEASLEPIIPATVMHKRNFAPRGHTPSEFMQTLASTRLVLNEIEPQAQGGPL